MDLEMDTSKEAIDQLNELIASYQTLEPSLKQWKLNRLYTHLKNLSTVLDAEQKKYDERVTRINELTVEHDNFHKVFLSKHQYYYMPYNNLYYEYDGKTYQIIKDDEIHHRLLSTITDEGKLISWKHKTKQNMIRTIKERSLIKSVPETYTIQNVLGFLNTIFETKSEAKYFLTVIGDCILKKAGSLLFFVNPCTKKLVSFIDSIAYVTTGNSIINNFISKYHETHTMTSYRLIKTNNSISSEIIKDVLNKIGIDFLCVAAHYSDRYGSSDDYLNTTSDVESGYTLYFTKNTIDQIVDEFLNKCIESTNTLQLKELNVEQQLIPEYKLTWKNMHYIWKNYLSSINVPNMIYSSNLKTSIKTRLQFTEEGNDISFVNVTSKFLPAVSNFLSFWDKHISITNSNTNTNTNTNNSDLNEFDDEYEIDEIVTMYKQYIQITNINANAIISNNISDEDVIKIISHYFSPYVEVIERKYVTNVKCNLWFKTDDIIQMLDNYKEHNKKGNSDSESIKDLISFDDLYKSYRTFCQAKVIVEKTVCLIVSKQFFEKFVSHYLHNFIQFEKFVSADWLQ
jgi:hypothetical protein